MTTSLKMPSPFGFAAPAPERPVEGEFGWSAGIRLLRRRWWQLLAITVAVCLLALPAILAKPKLYEAQARVMISPTPVPGLVSEDSARPETVSTDTEIERISSREMVQAIIDRFDLAERAEFNPTLQQESPFSWLVTRATAMVPTTEEPVATLAPQGEDRVVRSVLGHLRVGRVGAGNVVSVGFASEDPDLAAAVPAAIIETYRAQTDARWRADVSAASDWIESRIATANANIDESRSAIGDFEQRTGLQVGETAEEAADHLAMLQARKFELSKEQVDIASTRRSVTAALADLDLPAVNEPERLGELRRERDLEQRELERTASVYGEKYAGIAVHRSRIEAVEAEISSELEVYARSLEMRGASLEDEEARLTDQIAEARSSVAAIRNEAPELARLTASLETQEKSLADLQARRQRLDSETPISPVSLEVLSPATRPLHATGPGRKMYLMAAALGGLLIGLLAVTLQELRDDSVRSHEQLVHLPRLLPLGLLPALGGRQRRKVVRSIADREATPLTEALRDALFMLECANGGGLPPAIVITPARDTDSTPPVAEWLALELAAAGHRVRLVDARDPRPRGARRPIAGGSPLAAHPSVERLSLAAEVQTSGSLSDAVRRLIHEAEQRDTVTLFDAPPLHRSATLQLAQLTGTALLVMRWGATPRRLAELLSGLLGKLGDVRAYSLIAEVDPARHRRYGFSDRLSLAEPTRA